MNSILFAIALMMWQDDSKFLDSIRSIAVIQDEQQQESGSFEIIEPPQPEPRKQTGTIEIRDLQSSDFNLVASKIKTTKQVRYLVSEPWCTYCPAAKQRFLSSGGSPENIITIAQARNMGRTISGVPAEFTELITAETEVFQPSSYRSQWPAEIALNGTHTPTKSAMLAHLRGGGPHANKHWQKWHLESWSKEQLVALHEDDHHNCVPEFASASDDSEAIVSGLPCSLETIAHAISSHLVRKNPDGSLTSSSLFNIEIDTPDSTRGWIADLLSKQSLDFPASGVSAKWGGDRVISLGKGKFSIKPAVDVSVRKFGVSVSTKLTGASFSDDLSWISLELQGSPDLTIRFK